MNKPLRFALNRMVAPRLSLPDFIDLALALKTDGIEIRNDLKGVEIENGMPPARVRELCESRGIKVLSINARLCPRVRCRGRGDVSAQRSCRSPQRGRACGGATYGAQ